MKAQATGRRANALKREIIVRVRARSAVSPDVVYDTLADLHTYLEWEGKRQKPKMALLSMDAPDGAATVGTEFRTTGADPTGGFSDTSVVTEADRPRAFEFVTEAHLETKRGKTADWTNIHRYEIEPDGDGARIVYTARIARISSLPGPLALLKIGLLSSVLTKFWGRLNRRTVENLARVAEERADVG
jgi:Polyketide cyclase / dehydrase and lipid transport